MEIRFNASMFTNFNFSMLNASLVDIYIIPFAPGPDFNMSHLNFTWNLTYYEEDVMRIQLNFEYPKSISLNLEQDTIVFHIKNETQAFYSPEVEKQLHLESWTLTSKVRKQMANT